MKRIKLAVLASVVISTQSYAIFGVGDIVFDPEQTAKAVAQYAKQATAWKREIDQWKEKMSALKDFRLDGDILNKFTELNTLLDQYGLDMNDLDLNNPKSQIGVYAKQLFDSNTIFDNCNYDYMTYDQRRICKNKMLRSSKKMATVSKLSESMKGFVEKLNTLNSKLATSTDIKSSQDITAGIQSTLSSMNALKIQYEMMEIRDRAEAKMEEEQTEQIIAEKRKNSSAFIHQNFVN